MKQHTLSLSLIMICSLSRLTGMQQTETKVARADAEDVFTATTVQAHQKCIEAYGFDLIDTIDKASNKKSEATTTPLNLKNIKDALRYLITSGDGGGLIFAFPMRDYLTELGTILYTQKESTTKTSSETLLLNAFQAAREYRSAIETYHKATQLSITEAAIKVRQTEDFKRWQDAMQPFMELYTVIWQQYTKYYPARKEFVDQTYLSPDDLKKEVGWKS